MLRIVTYLSMFSSSHYVSDTYIQRDLFSRALTRRDNDHIFISSSITKCSKQLFAEHVQYILPYHGRERLPISMLGRTTVGADNSLRQRL